MNRRGLVAHYKYHGNVSALGTWYDISGNGNHGTLVGSAFVDNNGLNLDGNGDYVNCGNDSSLNITSNITLLCRVKRTAYNSDGSGIIAKTPPAGTAYGPYGLIESGTDHKIWFYLNNNSPQISLSNVVYDGVWVFIWATYDGSTMKLGVNDSAPATLNVSTTINSSSLDLSIGAYFYSGYMFNGDVDDVRIYNRALSAEEISQIYHQTKGKH